MKLEQGVITLHKTVLEVFISLFDRCLHFWLVSIEF